MKESRRARAFANALNAAAKELAAHAKRLEHQASSEERYADWLQRRETLPDLCREVAELLDAGRDQADAIAFVAEHGEVRADHLAWAFECFITRTRTGKLWHRDREIMRLAWAGKTNGEIAERLGLHPKSVSRIIRLKLNSGDALRPGAPVRALTSAHELITRRP